MTIYQQLCQAIDIPPLQQTLVLDSFTDSTLMAEKAPNERLTAALHVFLKLLQTDPHEVKRVDKILLDHYIAKIDTLLSTQLDTIMHHADFKTLESLWRGLKFLVDRTDFNANIKIEVLDINKESLILDFEEALDITQTTLYQHTYVQEYDTPGGEPISAIISDEAFDTSLQDIQLLQNIAKVAALAHCPWIGRISPTFFNKKTFSEVMRIEDLSSLMERAEYIKWNHFRESEEARYIGLTFPQFLLRLPYNISNSIRSFYYEENTTAQEAENYLWGSASFAFATNLVRSFKEHGWTVNIRGPESGGKIENLILHYYDIGMQPKIPLEILIPETRELEFANLGLIPLSCYKHTDTACFFSANSVQKPAIYDSKEMTANSRINSRLPYVFLSSRLGHYLKVLQREHIGSNRSRDALEKELNGWLQTLVTRMSHPGPEVIASHPLREGRVEVLDIPENPGYYRINLHVVPHFQVEGIDVQLSLTGQIQKKL